MLDNMIFETVHPLVEVFWNYFPFTYLTPPILKYVGNAILFPIYVVQRPLANFWNAMPFVVIPLIFFYGCGGWMITF